MGVIKERQMKLGTIYERYDSKGNIIQTAGALGFVKESTEKGFTYFMIMDLNGQLIEDANTYLNTTIQNSNYKKIEKAFTALKLFFAFLSLYSLNDYKNDFTNENLTQLRTFLEGGKIEGKLWNIDLSARSNSTVNSYIGVYRDFYKKMYRINDNPLFDKYSIEWGQGKKEKYSSNESSPIPTQVPMYIKPDEYSKIIEDIKEYHSLRDKIIVDLMYQYGLRIGEVLGLTLEDIDESELGNPRIIIRNRVSDRPDQSAKGVLKVKSAHKYKTSEYRTYGVGFQIVYISQYMKEEIEEYIDESRDEFLLNRSDKKRNNLDKLAFADYIGTKSLENNENQYLFLSDKRYSPLTQVGWNFVLRDIFTKAGIPLDKVVREHNLNHRFRHGFAMVRVRSGVGVEELAEELRHRSTESCKAYYRPDEKDKVELLNKNQDNQKEKYQF
ncbi:tyrosine-type recombinase/integrase [Pelosinus propionicus]|uniref:Integrase/recombinase XerD n=1 Tax=Pelosinus propionicus DSM 13327 TaxID=1123291 RepID=A0A1I4JUT9_9FIRM|nr:site-specific integrase [Pelosinus propionicus]SFL70329.1 integrase/recombinase XerD [Pelosinus propionicus DSM 13327]